MKKGTEKGVCCKKGGSCGLGYPEAGGHIVAPGERHHLNGAVAGTEHLFSYHRFINCVSGIRHVIVGSLPRSATLQLGIGANIGQNVDAHFRSICGVLNPLVTHIQTLHLSAFHRAISSHL